MIAHEGGVRWAANAPSAELLAAALRDQVPAQRREFVPFGLLRSLEEGGEPARQVWRLWMADGPPVLFKHYAQQADYRVELSNLRFYNAVAREFTPRLLACDDTAAALLVEDSPGTVAADSAALGSEAAVIHLWERVLLALARIHVRAARQSTLLRRLSAPQRPETMRLPREDLLEAAAEVLAALHPAQPLLGTEHKQLQAASNWLRTLLAGQVSRSSIPTLGLRSAHQIVVSAQRVHFTDLRAPPLGRQEADLAPSWGRPERRALVERTYLAELTRREALPDRVLFWQLDAAFVIVGCAARLIQLGGVQPDAHSIPEAARRLVLAIRDAAAELPPLAEAVQALTRRAGLASQP
jgi:hypothetical protein